LQGAKIGSDGADTGMTGLEDFVTEDRNLKVVRDEFSLKIRLKKATGVR